MNHSPILRRGSRHRGLQSNLRCGPAVAAVLILIGWPTNLLAQADRAQTAVASWQIPTVPQISQAYEAWLQTRSLPASRRAALLDQWRSQAAAHSKEPLLDDLIAAIVRARPELDELVQRIELTRESVDPTLRDHLGDLRHDPFCADHLRLLALVRWSSVGLYDEALAIADGLEPSSVLQPQLLLLHRAIAHHQLAHREPALTTTRLLLEQRESLPRRFVVIAELIGRDLENFERDTLDEIVRLMQDAQRRTRLNRAGRTVLQQEVEVLEKLDRLIDRLEEEQRANRQAKRGKSQGPQKPLDTSRKVEGKGSGDVAAKTLPKGGTWGDIPPEEKAATLAEMTRDLPPHFRSIVEEYFRNLAKEEDDDR